jgi:hypothetical protein
VSSDFIRTKIVDFEPREITGWELVKELIEAKIAELENEIRAEERKGQFREL